MTELTYDVTSRIADSGYIEAPFNQAKKKIEKARCKIISTEENAMLRMQEGRWAEITKKGNITRECLIFIPGEQHYFFSKISPIIESAEKATQIHRERKEFCPTRNQLERATDPSVSIKIPLNQKYIPIKRLLEEEAGEFILGQSLQDYSNFLRESKIKEFPINISYIEELFGRAIAKPFIFRGLNEINKPLETLNQSNLSYNLRTRGIYLHNKIQ